MNRLITELTKYDTNIIDIKENATGVLFRFNKGDDVISVSIDNVTKPIMQNVLEYYNITFPEPANTESFEAIEYNDIAAIMENWIDETL